MTVLAADAARREWHRLRQEVKAEKRAIDQHRDALKQKAAALARFEAECRARGIPLVLVAPSGVGVVHGPDCTHP